MKNNANTIFRLMTSAGSISLLTGQLRMLREASWRVTVLSGGSQEQLSSISEAEGVDSHFIPHLVRPISIPNDLRALAELILLFRRKRPYIVHANTPKASLLGMVAAWWCRVPHRIYMVTGLRFETSTGLFRWLLVTMERITCACATKVIPEGDGVAETLKRNNITKKPLKKVLNGNINGIDLAHFNRTGELIEEADQIVEKFGGVYRFVFVGRIVKDKGLVELVTAFERFQEKYLDARLFLVGKMEPELDPLPKDILDIIKNNDGIIEAGWQDDVRPWLVASNALLFPSYREGFPNVVIQAGAMGLPSVVSDINGCNEIIIEGENGYIVPTHDAEALYERMLCLVENKEKTEYMSQRARPLIESRYKQEDVWNALLNEYNSLIENK